MLAFSSLHAPIDWLALLGVGRTQSNAVLLVRLDAIGDFVLWLRSARQLRRHFQGRKIVLLANSAWADLARELPYWDEVWAVSVKQLDLPGPYRWRLWRRLRGAGFAVAVQPTLSRVFSRGDAAIWASAAPQRIGSAGTLNNSFAAQLRWASRWYTRLVPVHWDAVSSLNGVESERHEFGYNDDFVAALTGSVSPELAPELLSIPDSCAKNLRPDAPYFLVSPGVGWTGKQWPGERFATIINRLVDERGWRAVLCGAQSESAVSSAVARICSRPPINLTGKTTLFELVELIQGACLVLGNDSAPVHLAAAIGIPSISILGGGHFGRFLPYPPGRSPRAPEVVFAPMECYHCNWQCTQPHDSTGPVPCISAVSVETVLAAITRTLNTVVSGGA